MRRIPTSGGSNVWIGRVEPPYDFQSPCGGEEFALLLVLGEECISADDQWELSSKFVHQGCRYAVCFGYAGASWDESIDMVGVMEEIDGRPTPFVMTTWHDDESLRDVADFFATQTTLEDWKPKQFVVLFVGVAGELEAEARLAVEEAFGGKST